MSADPRTADAIVIGGGLVGAAIAYGLQSRGLDTLLLDEGDDAVRASRGNFGLIWVQSKGDGVPEYQRWTRRSADAWAGLAADLIASSGIDPAHHRPGGIDLCLDDAEFEARAAMMARLKAEAGNFGFDYRMLDRAEIADLLPGLGPAVRGGSFTAYDGHAGALALLYGLHRGLAARGGRYRPGAEIRTIQAAPNDFRVALAGQTVAAPRLVLAAGLGNRALAPLVGLAAPVDPLRGQILVTERARPLLPMPTTTVRQTAEGSFLLGDSHEDVGFDLGQAPDVMAAIARRAALAFPFLADLQVVRAWSALRVMSPDGLPIYDQSERCPGAFVANCHSGVTLAAAHAGPLAGMIAAGALDGEIARFSARRFDVPQAA